MYSVDVMPSSFSRRIFSSCSAWTLFSFPVEMMINQKEIYMRTPMTNVVEFHSPCCVTLLSASSGSRSTKSLQLITCFVFSSVSRLASFFGNFGSRASNLSSEHDHARTQISWKSDHCQGPLDTGSRMFLIQTSNQLIAHILLMV